MNLDDLVLTLELHLIGMTGTLGYFQD